MTPSAPVHRVWSCRIGWLFLIWTASVATLAIVATAVRVLMNLAGMTA